MIYNKKAQRINDIMVYEIMADESAWYTPLSPTKEQLAEWKRVTKLEE